MKNSSAKLVFRFLLLLAVIMAPAFSKNADAVDRVRIGLTTKANRNAKDFSAYELSPCSCCSLLSAHCQLSSYDPVRPRQHVRRNG